MTDRDYNTDDAPAEAVLDAVTGEELVSFTGQVADGRAVTVRARDEDTARRLIREQTGVGVLSIAEGDGTDVHETAGEVTADDADDDNDGIADTFDDPNADDARFTEHDAIGRDTRELRRGDDAPDEPTTTDDPRTPAAPLPAAVPTQPADAQGPQFDNAQGTDAAPDGVASGETGHDVSTSDE